jgi:hypothetical protein
MAMGQKAQHVDGRDVALDLILLSRGAFHQESNPETYYSSWGISVLPASLSLITPFIQTGAVETGLLTNWLDLDWKARLKVVVIVKRH